MNTTTEANQSVIRNVSLFNEDNEDITELIITQLKEFNNDEIKNFLKVNDIIKSKDKKPREIKDKTFIMNYDLIKEDFEITKALSKNGSKVIYIEENRKLKEGQKKPITDPYYFYKVGVEEIEGLPELNNKWLKFNSLIKCKDFLNNLKDEMNEKDDLNLIKAVYNNVEFIKKEEVKEDKKEEIKEEVKEEEKETEEEKRRKKKEDREFYKMIEKIEKDKKNKNDNVPNAIPLEDTKLWKDRIEKKTSKKSVKKEK